MFHVTCYMLRVTQIHMNGLIDSFNPLFSRYKSEVILLGCALLIGIISLTLFFQQQKSEKSAPVITKNTETRTITKKQTITIDVSGAVKNPFVYTFDSNARIIDAIQKAGGFTEDADVSFVKRSVNYARIMNDQEKIYIPFLADTINGYILENKRVIDYTQPNSVSVQSTDASRMNINSASVLELDQLPGVGPVISEAIFNGRPYTSPEDLVQKSIIKQSVYDKIKGLISVY